MRDSTANPATVVGALRSSGFRELAIRCERVFGDCSQDVGTYDLDDKRHEVERLKSEATKMIDDLTTLKSRNRPKPRYASGPAIRSSTKRPAGVTTAMAILIAAALLGSCPNAFGAPAADRSLAQPEEVAGARISITSEQQHSILAEAVDQYTTAQNTAAKDSAESKQAFAEAAEKFEFLVNSGVRNSRLLINLGNAYLQSGQTGRAIANYRRALQLELTNGTATQNLTYAESHLKSSPAAASGAADKTGRSYQTFWDVLDARSSWISGHIAPKTLLAAIFLAWLAIWCVVGLRIVGYRFPWKGIVIAASVPFVMAAASYVLTLQDTSRHVAVVVVGDATLREGDGPDFPAVTQTKLQEGQSVEYEKQRGEWLRIRTEDGQSGWVSCSAVEVI
jgi:hypothetical protein